MNYRVTLTPFDSSQLTWKVVDTSGVTHEVFANLVITEAQAQSLASLDSANSKVSRAILLNTVQCSAAQLAAMLLYFAAVQAGTNTGAVETAINAL